MTLEVHDELALPWDRWADGRVHRLVKGRDFLQAADLVEEAAENAAQRLGKVARTTTEVRFANTFIWVQFVDGQLEPGEPCPCGSHDLRRVTSFYLECGACKSTLFMREPRQGKRSSDDAPPSEQSPILQELFGAGAAASTRGKRRRNRGGRRSEPATAASTPLGEFNEIVLFTFEKDEKRERLYGHAVDRGKRPWLIALDIVLTDGVRLEDPGYPGGVVHVMRGLPASPFGALVRLESFPVRPPDLQIDDPNANLSGTPAAHAELAALAPPPEALAAFEELTLFPQSGSPPGTREFGYAKTVADGEAVLLTVRYRGRGGRDEATTSGDAVHSIRSVPLVPFGDVIDVAKLYAGDVGDGEPVSQPRQRGRRTGA